MPEDDPHESSAEIWRFFSSPLMKPFSDRFEAGRFLAPKLAHFRECPGAIVLALHKGGVPVAYEIAKDLHILLDIILVRKLRVSGSKEAMGAVVSGGMQIINNDTVAALNISEATINSVARQEQEELRRQDRFYRGNRPVLNVFGATVILVDDCLATGTTMKAAVLALRKQEPSRIIIAVPVAAPDTCTQLRPEVDEIVCSMTAEPFGSVGDWYESSIQLSDEEVAELLDRALVIKQSGPEL
jgi:putative phosphoribosyl transferase